MLKIIKILFFNFIVLIFAFSLIIFLDIKIGEKMNLNYAGYNYKGYRGYIKEQKKKNYQRIVTLGGSTTFGYGTNFLESWPYQLEENLKKNNFKYDVVNLGIQSNRIKGIYLDLLHYDYLNYDLAIIYSGYNDCFYKGKIDYLSRHDNFFFRNFNYLPIIQIYIVEKLVLTLNLNLEDYYLNKKKKTNYLMCNDPNIKKITNEEIDKFTGQIDKNYIRYYEKVIDLLNSKKKKIIVMHQPLYGGELQQIQKMRLIESLKKYNSIIQIDMEEYIKTNNKNLFLDDMHLTKQGNSIIAQKIYNLLIDKIIKQ